MLRNKYMDALVIIGSILMVLGIIGSIIPALPGPVLGYIGLVLLYFAKPGAISVWSLIVFGISMLMIIVIDYVAPILGAKFSGASKKGLIGAIAGSLVGIIFFPPMGIFLGALLGAFLGELAQGKEPGMAIKAGIGTIFGSILVIVLQTIFSLVMTVYFFLKLFS
jgi:uncharacterized protein YqgC (DUF456 family)